MSLALPRLALLATGGTIAARAAAAGATTGYRLDAAGPDLDPALGAALTGVAQIAVESVARLPSSDLTGAHLLDIAGRVRRLMADPAIDGIIVTHGTDTLEETALFLDRVAPRGKPLVLTGAMRPAGALGADGPRNLLNAARIAGTPEAAAYGALVTMDDRIIAAGAARKRHATAQSAFQPDADGQVGAIVADRAAFGAAPPPQAARFDLANLQALPVVEILYAYQDHAAYLFDAVVAAGAKGLVLACTGNGTLSATGRKGVEHAMAHGMVVVRSSRTGAGHVSWEGTPGIPSGPFNPQQARILLMLALTETTDPERIAAHFRAA